LRGRGRGGRRVRLEIRVGDGGEGTDRSGIAATVAGALALFRGKAGDGSGAVDGARLEVLLRPRHGVRVRRVTDFVRRGGRGFEARLKLVDAVVFGAEVLTTLDGESRFAEGRTAVFGGVGDLRCEEGCAETSQYEGRKKGGKRGETHDLP